ncbi:RluA family pseudouridine synthase [Rickettsiales bacterium]|nr:RluA family pseudouridine synthase [Rickettsiales bacterium]
MTKVEMVKVSDDDGDIRVDRWFKRNYPNISHSAIEKALRKGQIRVDGKKTKSNERVQAGQEIRVPPFDSKVKAHNESEKKILNLSKKQLDEFNSWVIFEDSDILVINKPSGLSVQGGTGVGKSVDTFLSNLSKDGIQLRLVHRLDKDTSGVLIIAKNAKTATWLTEYFRTKKIKKYYLAVTKGIPKPLRGAINQPIKKDDQGAREKMICAVDGKKSLTNYITIDKSKDVALLQLEPETGRKHQIRVHLLSIGCPILGDGKYGGRDAFIDNLSNKLHLHAQKIEFKNPHGKKLSFTAGLPYHIKETIGRFGFKI